MFSTETNPHALTETQIITQEIRTRINNLSRILQDAKPMHTKNTIKKRAYVNLKVQRRNLNLPTISLNTIWPSLLPFR